MTESIKPDVSVKLWLEKPDAAEALMNSSSDEATDYAAMGVWVSLSILATIIMNTLIKRAAGPHGGLLQLGFSIFKKLIPGDTTDNTNSTDKQPT